jgi:hypothetical protein
MNRKSGPRRPKYLDRIALIVGQLVPRVLSDFRAHNCLSLKLSASGVVLHPANPESDLELHDNSKFRQTNQRRNYRNHG